MSQDADPETCLQHGSAAAGQSPVGSQKLVAEDLRLGPVAIGFPAVQAALAGYTDWPARIIARRLGAPYTLAEATLAGTVLEATRRSKLRRLLWVTDEEHPCGAQLLGSDADELAEAARALAAAGFDVVDLNFACPVRKVLNRCRGGSLLGRPGEALAIVARLRDALPPEVPLTLKLRRGIDDSPQSRQQFFEIFDGAFRRGAEAVTVHGRTVRQKYEGRSSWAFLREVKEHAGPRTVLGSGDLLTPHDCLAMLAETGVDGLSVARGAIGNPWIFGRVRALAAGRPASPPSLAEQREVIAEHCRLAEEYYGPKRSLGVMRKAGIKYSRLHPRADEVRDAFVAASDPQQWRQVLDRWYGPGG